jgi:anaerobic magnesium-protoporphyrin IX monomethyl ester cyclase
MKIALIQLPHFYGENHSRPPAHYPNGLGYIASVLSSNGIDRDGINLWERELTVDQAIRSFDYSRYDVFGISAYSTQYKYLKEFSLKLKLQYPKIPIICGGPGPTFSSKIILANTGVDFCVIGEGEITIIELLKNLNEPQNVAGISYKINKEIIYTAPREYIKDLDLIPFPDREIFDFRVIIERKISISKQYDRKQYISADIIAGRGCPYHCTFCSKTFSGVRLRSIDNIILEAIQLKEQFGINHLQFDDELVLINKKRTLELCARIKELKLWWSCQGRIDQVDEEILRILKDSGCIELGYGVESASQSILDRMNKRIKADNIIPIIKMTREIGITPIIQYMYGYPGETDETIEKTYQFFKKVDIPFVGSTTTPIPGSSLYDDCIKNRIIKDEENYLLSLDSGYNLVGGRINLTNFTDHELMRKQRKLQIRITHNYLKKRPLQYISFISGVILRKIVRIIKRITDNKLLLSTHN